MLAREIADPGRGTAWGPPGTVLAPPRVVELANGMRVVLQHDARLPLVAAHLCLLGGSRIDPDHLPGLAHLCEHLAFQGPGGEYSQLVERAGGESRATTHHDVTVFEHDLPAHLWDLGLEIEARRLTSAAAIDPESVDRERRVLLRELDQQADNRPERRGIEEVQRLLFPRHPYGRPPRGTRAGLLAVTADDVEAYLAACYRPASAVLALVGNFPAEHAVERIRELFEDLPSGPPPARSDPWQPPEPTTAGPRRQRCPGLPGARTYLAFRSPGLTLPERFAAQLWSRAAAIGRSSPLPRRLQALGIAGRLQAGMVHLRDAGTVCLHAAPAPGVDTGDLERGLVDGLAEVVERGIPDELRARAARQAVHAHYVHLERLDRRAAVLATAEALCGETAGLDDDADRLQEVGRAELDAFARRHAGGGRAVVLSLSPETPP